jgi:predicted N-acetyltransferase YhbS
VTSIRQERSTDIWPRERLLDAAFGPARVLKTSERLREGRLAADGLSFVAVANGRLIGTARLWNIAAGLGRPALLLGPVAVAEDLRRRGIGTKLVSRALSEARRFGHRAVLVIGDAAYYGRFGFDARPTAALRLPGPFQPERFLGLELVSTALDRARGHVRATGGRAPKDMPFLNYHRRGPSAADDRPIRLT